MTRKYAWILLIAGIAAGCAARPYRVARVGGLYYLYPPGHKVAPLRQERVALAPAPGPARQCGLSGEAFSLEWRGSRPVVVTRLSKVLHSASYNQEAMRDAIEQFRAGLEKLEADACLPPGGAGAAVDAVAERVPNLASETVFLRYGFNRWKGYIDLSPGVTVNVQWALSRGTEPWGTDLANMDVGARRYSIERNGARFVRGADTITTGQAPSTGIPDLAVSRMAHHRLFFLTKYVQIAGEPERHAAIVGAPRIADLREYSAKFLEDPDLTCQGKLTRTPPECIAVDKRISFVPEIQVSVNGQPAYLLVGADLRGLLASRKATGPFTLERRYGAEYRKMLFPPGDTEALRIPLLEGDRLTITPSSSLPSPAPSPRHTAAPAATPAAAPAPPATPAPAPPSPR